LTTIEIATLNGVFAKKFTNVTKNDTKVLGQRFQDWEIEKLHKLNFKLTWNKTIIQDSMAVFNRRYEDLSKVVHLKRLVGESTFSKLNKESIIKWKNFVDKGLPNLTEEEVTILKSFLGKEFWKKTINDINNLNNMLHERFAEVKVDEIFCANDYIYGDIDSSNPILITKFNTDFLQEHIQLLKPSAWLNDEVINFYMAMLQERSNLLKGECHFFASHFFTRLIGPERNQRDFRGVMSWSKKFNVFSRDKVFIPVNIINNHWFLIVVHVQKKEIVSYDSFNNDHTFYLDILMDWLLFEANDSSAMKKKVRKAKPPINKTEWTLRKEQVPQQHNTCDCGVFIIMFADFILENIPLTICEPDMLDFRLKIALAISFGILPYTLPLDVKK
jgi:Ulp1 family protease